MEKKWEDFTEQEKNEFSEKFYELWKKELPFKNDLQDNPCPWGCPWEYAPEGKAVSSEDFFEFCKGVILHEALYKIPE